MTRVLLVEDNPAMLDSITLELEMRGYEVLPAINGVDALAVLSRELPATPDLIISDIAMPDMDGFKLLEAVHADDRYADLPFIFLTAFSSPNAELIGRDLGADDYILKPFKTDDLVTAMESKLGRIRQIKQIAERQMAHIRTQLEEIVRRAVRPGLNQIMDEVEALRPEAQSLSNTGQQAVDRLVRTARATERALGQLVLLAQLDTGALRSELAAGRAVIDLRATLSEARDSVLASVDDDAQGTTVELDLPADPLLVDGSADFLRTAAEEVLRNALDFSSPGDVVTVRAYQNGPAVHIEFEDSGVGIPSDVAGKVWDRFTRVPSARPSAQGLGLGLALTSQIVAEHGGGSSLVSSPGTGTTVLFTLPAHED